ncbi:hypothetical protein FQN57_004017 [Myotisia sp. PD_48]|nr:hypothetical protein FQN57_004017 [Myotisia sp. PD_48]
MASYEVEHSTTETDNRNISREGNAASRPSPRRPDLSTFFATLNELAPSQGEERTRPYAVPVPGDISAAFRTLAEAFDVMRRSSDTDAPLPTYDGTETTIGDSEQNTLVENMIRTLLQEADTPPREVEGVTEEFCDTLERIPASKLNKSQSCPICNNPFLDDQYPLVVRLPCHTSHMFDLECIRPWLRLRGTCPLDREDFGKKERQKEQERLERLKKRANGTADEDEDDWDEYTTQHAMSSQPSITDTEGEIPSLMRQDSDLEAVLHAETRADPPPTRRETIIIPDIDGLAGLIPPGSYINLACPVRIPTIECEICGEKIVVGKGDYVILACRHPYCRECLQRLFWTAVKDEFLFPPQCCHQRIMVSGVESLLTEDILKAVTEKQEEFDRSRTYCVSARCSALILPEHIDGNQATCIKCGTITCTLCKGEAHASDCPKDTHMEQLHELAAEKGWQKCFWCRRLIELEAGCFHVR